MTSDNAPIPEFIAFTIVFSCF